MVTLEVGVEEKFTVIKREKNELFYCQIYHNEVLHLTFPCMEIFFHTWKKNSMDGEKRFPWQSETDLGLYISWFI